MRDCAIFTQHLSRDFGSVRAVRDLALEVPGGIVFGFLGPNGAGKTTTIRLLLGLLAPTKGSARVLGFDTVTQADEIRARTGALLEHHGLYERLTAEENLEFYGRIYRMPAGKCRARSQELLEHMGLWERRKDLVRDLSRGMKQKLAVARTLLAQPDLVFLDEPTSGLDPVASVALRDDLAGLAAKGGVTIFLNTHNLQEAEKLCQQVGVIRGGRLLMYPPEGIAAVLTLPLLFSLLSLVLGVHVSLRSATVRQAQQILGLIGMIPVLPIAVVPMLPKEFVENLANDLSPVKGAVLVLVAVGIFAAIDLALVALAVKRFQRSRLILD